MKGRWLLDRRAGRLGKAHELDGVGCLHDKATSSIRGDAGLHRHRLSKAYSVYSVLDAQGESLGQGRIDHAHPEDFHALVRRWPGCRVVFEVGMNWHWLFEILERELSPERIVLANPFKTRIIAEAQIKTDKVDARILADLLRAKLISSVHVVGRESRQIKEVLRQRCFFVRQRTMLHNRIHRLLGGQQEVKLPQCSDLFGRKGLSLLEKLELPAPARLLLTQQLALLKELAVRIREDEETLEELLQENPALNYVTQPTRYGTNPGCRGRH